MKIAQGAEAVIKLTNSEGASKIIKKRIAKNYRIKDIDTPLREQRTKTETRLLREARRAGVSTPQVLDVNNDTIKMEFIDGKLVKNLLNSADDISDIAYNIGTNIGKLHSAGIVHGDLTTSNMISSGHRRFPKEGKAPLFFIDFGLGFFSQRIEDYAQDLAVLKQAVQSTHFDKFELIWSQIKQGYSHPQKTNIFKTLQQIETRGRYVKKSV